jgi:hypothetical protein
MIALSPMDDAVTVECSKQRNGPPFPSFTLKPVMFGDGLALLPASDVLPDDGLTPTQEKVLGILRSTFDGTGASKTEWQRASLDVPERSFHRAAKVLVERGRVRLVRSRFRIADGGQR